MDFGRLHVVHEDACKRRLFAPWVLDVLTRRATR